MDADSRAGQPDTRPQADLLASQLRQTSPLDDSPDLRLLQASSHPLDLRRHIQAGRPTEALPRMTSSKPPFWLAAIPLGENKTGRGTPLRKGRALQKGPPSAPTRSRQPGEQRLEPFEPDAADRMLAIDLKVVEKRLPARWTISATALVCALTYLWLR